MADINATWPALPTETEIYILPNGEIIVADLPEELAARLAAWLPSEANKTAEEPESCHVPKQPPSAPA